MCHGGNSNFSTQKFVLIGNKVACMYVIKIAKTCGIQQSEPTQPTRHLIYIMQVVSTYIYVEFHIRLGKYKLHYIHTVKNQPNGILSIKI